MERNAWPYVAGIVDGEGTICANYRKQGDYILQVIIYNTSTVLMKWLIKNFGGKYYVRSVKSWNGKPGKIQYMWRPSGKKNRENFLLGILPYLVMKTEQAKLALEFIRLPHGTAPQRKIIAAKMKLLNRPDISVETNTLDAFPEAKIESELVGDYESDPVVT
jgi:hypothetical protein